MEPTCLGVLGLRHDRTPDVEVALDAIEKWQNRDGSWPIFASDEAEGCWTTSLAILTLLATRPRSEHIRAGVGWLLDATGREASWFWRWKFQMVDNGVKFDPAKYGWSWVPGTASWVIPTAFSLIALQQVRDSGLSQGTHLNDRLNVGNRMLLDRMCPGGGWNAGNGIAFGVAYAPYVDATSIGLLALRRCECEAVQASVSWLASRLADCSSPYSLAWGILALTAYRKRSAKIDDALSHAADGLMVAINNTRALDTSTLAICVLALEAVDGDNVFEVRG
jgi:hypothetical protein